MLGEAVDEGAEAGRVAEDGAPLLVGEVRGDDDRAALVPVTDDAEEQVRAVGVAGDVAELVDDEEVAAGVAAQPPLDRGDGLAAEQVRGDLARADTGGLRHGP